MFVVEIFYRELSYETRHGRKDAPYRWRFRAHASSPSVAIGAAVAEFRRMEALSSVGWTREIMDIQVLTGEAQQ
jgi:hypothetical protein